MPIYIQYTYDHTFSNATVFYLALALFPCVVLVFLNEESILVCFLFLFLMIRNWIH
jgi:hypothetical protein